MSYRFDSRSKNQFKEDILLSSKMELKLMKQYVLWLNATKQLVGDKVYSFIDNGCDNSGKFLEDNEVDGRADFILKRYGQANRPIDIKFCREERDVFHLKISQLNTYIKNNVCIVNFMAVNTKNSRFCIITPKDIEVLIKSEPVIFWSKMCIRVYCSDRKWFYI